MKKSDNFTQYQIKMCALNFERFLNNAIQNNIKIQNISRFENEVSFKIGKREYQFLKETYLNNIEYQIIKVSGWGAIFPFCLNRIGIIAGIMLSLVIFLIFNSFILNVNIMGNTYIPNDIIMEKLKEVGVSKFKSSDFSAPYVEEHLLSQIDDISMVSIKKIGTSVIVNIKEKIENNLDLKENIVSQFNMLVTSVNVYSGTSNVKVGDFVKSGDVLVYAYAEDGNGEMVNCEPLADIDGEVWFTSREYFKNQTTELVRTGKKEVFTNFNLQEIKLINNTKNSSFQKFEKEEKEYYLSNFLLPIKIKKVIYYELEEVNIDHDFSLEQEKLVNKCYQEAIEKMPEGMPLISEDVEINPIQDGYVVSVYLKSKVEIRSKTNEN